VLCKGPRHDLQENATHKCMCTYAATPTAQLLIQVPEWLLLMLAVAQRHQLRKVPFNFASMLAGNCLLHGPAMQLASRTLDSQNPPMNLSTPV
jgi:hypothetical protein